MELRLNKFNGASRAADVCTRNLTEQDFRNECDIDAMFSSYAFEVNPASSDLYFWGIKK